MGGEEHHGDCSTSEGHCIAHMATTHVSEVSDEMLSGMVPTRELKDRYRYLHPGRHMHTSACWREPSTPTHHSCISNM